MFSSNKGTKDGAHDGAHDGALLRTAAAASAPVGAAAGPKPVWRSLPAMTPGAMAAAAYGSAVAPPVYRSLRVVRPGGAAEHGMGAVGARMGGDLRGSTAAAGPSASYMPGAKPAVGSAAAVPQYRGASAAHTMPYAKAAQYRFNVKCNPNYAVNSDTGGLKFVGPTAAAQAAQQRAAQQPQQLTQAPTLPLVFQRSAKHFVVSGISLGDLSAHMHDVARKQDATLVVKPHKATMELSKVAPPTAPDEGCSDVVFKIRVFALQADPTQFLMDFTHRKGSRVIACELYREVVSALRAVNAIQTPEHDHLLAGGQPGGGARPCKVYTVPAFRRAPGDAAPVAIEPAVAAATVKPLLAAAASPCFDQQRSSCQLLAKLTASKGAARTAAGGGNGGGGNGGAGAMAVDEDEEEDSSDYMASAIVGAMFDTAAQEPVVNLLACLCDPVVNPLACLCDPPAAGAAPGAAPGAQARPQVHEDVRRCIISTVANMALMEAQQLVATDGSGTHTRRLIEAAKALEAVRRALPAGAHPVHQGTYSSPQARDALRGCV